MSESLEKKSAAYGRDIVRRQQVIAGDDIADGSGARFDTFAQPFDQRRPEILHMQAAGDLDQLDDPVAEAARVVVYMGTQAPGGEMGQFKMGVGVDEAG